MTRNIIMVAGSLTLAACSSSDPATTNESPEPSADSTSYAYVATRSSDYGSGRIDRFSISDGYTFDASYPATLSDIAVTTDDTNVYQIGRFGIDSLTRFDAVDTSVVDFQITVNDDSPDNANPQSLAFVNDTKAYLTRRGSTELWIINPEAGIDTPLKTGGIDLSAYDADLPNMTDALIVGTKLFVIVERLLEIPPFSQVPDKSAYLVVIDTTTDMEIETEQGANGLMGIELLVRNPTALQYNETTGQVYVVGRGNFNNNAEITTDFHSGGIEAIDPDTYTHEMIIDDGTDEDNQGYFYDIEVVNASLGYLLTYQSFGVTTLRTFNPITGLLSDDSIAGLQDVDITTLAQGPDNHLWVGINAAAPGFHRIDLATGLVADEIVATELIPLSVTFIDVPAQ